MFQSILDQLKDQFALPLQGPVLVFCVVLFIILLAPLVLRQLKVPGVIGLIISGVIIGPHALNILEKNSAVDLFSTIGLLYIMFIAGLDLDLDEFRRYRNKSIAFGLFTFAVPLAVGYPVCRYLLEFEPTASLLIASMFSTHTLVAYPIVSKLGVHRHQVVAITVGGTILTDTAVLLLFAVIMGTAGGGPSHAFWSRLMVSMLFFFMFMFLALPRIARWFFSRLESEKTSHYVFVLAAVFFSAFLAKLAGLEPIIGAFVAGLAINRLIPRSSALMNRLEFVGNALFIPFFLISVGMIVDVRVLTQGPGVVFVATVLTVVALLGKWIAALFTQWSFGYSGPQRQLIFGLSSSHAAATLAIILVGYRADMINELVLNGTIILILITCLVSSFVTEAAAKQVLVTSETVLGDNVPKDAVRKERILIPCADPLTAQPLLDLAAMIRERTDAQPVILANVVENDDRAEEQAERMKERLDAQAEQAAASEMEVRTMVTIDNNIAGGIIRLAKETGSDLVLIGWSDDVSLVDRLFGPRTDALLRNFSRAILVARFVMPIASHSRLVLLAPPLAEHEPGFAQWVLKVHRLAKDLTIPVDLLCTSPTMQAVAAVSKAHRIVFAPQHVSIAAQGEMEERLLDHTASNDLAIIISPRPRSVSYNPALEQLPRRLDRQFNGSSFILFYPATKDLRENVLELT